MRDFEGCDGVALVTGGTGGIGSEVCRLLAARGSDIAFTFHSNQDAADALVIELEAFDVAVMSAGVDLAHAAAVAEVVATLTDVDGVHTLVHAAGPRVPQVHLSTVAPEEFARHTEAEVAGFFNVVSACLPDLREHRGSIVAVTSAATDRYPVRDGLSAAPKAAVEALVRAVAAEEGRYGVRANAVGPGMLTEGMAAALMDEGHYSERDLEVAEANIALRRFGSARDVAEAVAFLASPAASYISGQIVNVDGGYSV